MRERKPSRIFQPSAPLRSTPLLYFTFFLSASLPFSFFLTPPPLSLTLYPSFLFHSPLLLTLRLLLLAFQPLEASRSLLYPLSKRSPQFSSPLPLSPSLLCTPYPSLTLSFIILWFYPSLYIPPLPLRILTLLVHVQLSFHHFLRIHGQARPLLPHSPSLLFFLSSFLPPLRPSFSTEKTRFPSVSPFSSLVQLCW